MASQDLGIRIRTVLRAARRLRALTQGQAAEIIGVDQSGYSRIESGQASITIEQWLTFCRQTEIPVQSAEYGVIDFTLKADPLHVPIPNPFHVPQKYIQNAGETVRSLLPIVLFASRAGEAQFDDFLQQLKIDPDFFVVMDQRLNYRFKQDVLNYLTQNKLLTPKRFPEMFTNIGQAYFHGNSDVRYRGIKQPEKLIRAWMVSQSLYQDYFSHELTSASSDTLELKILPTKLLRAFDFADSTMFTFEERYIKAYLKEFLRTYLGPKVAKCSIQIQFAS